MEGNVFVLDLLTIALQAHIFEVIWDTNTERCCNSIPRDVLVIMLRNGFDKGGLVLTFQNCDTSLRVILDNSPIGRIRQRIFADTQFGPYKAKRHSNLMVIADDDVYWLPQIIARFELKLSGVKIEC